MKFAQCCVHPCKPTKMLTKNGRKNDLITKYIPMHEIKHLYPVHAKLHFYSLFMILATGLLLIGDLRLRFMLD